MNDFNDPAYLAMVKTNVHLAVNDSATFQRVMRLEPMGVTDGKPMRVMGTALYYDRTKVIAAAETTDGRKALVDEVTKVVNRQPCFPLKLERVQEIIEGDSIEPEEYEALFEHYCNSGEMPYGTAKARTGDPDQWIMHQLELEFGPSALK